MINIEDFCGDDTFRPWIKSPFSLGEFTYATNGAIAIRVARRDGFEERNREGKLLDEWLTPLDGARFERPKILLPATEEVSKKVECDECQGRGKYHDCPDCCCTRDECDGKGAVQETEKISVEAFGGIYRLPFLSKILALPGAEIADTPRNGKKPALFRFDGGEAAIMPLRVHLEKRVEIETVPA